MCFFRVVEIMCDHGHSHDHGASGGGVNGPERGEETSLLNQIDIDNVICLNETTDGSGKTVFKPWENRLDRSKLVVSDADEELLFNIPFTGAVKLKGVVVIGGEEGSHPSTMRLFKDRPQMCFDDAGAAADQELEMARDDTGAIEYGVKVVKFSSITSLSIHFPSNFGDESTKIYYIGLRGEFLGVQRREAVVCVYEARAIPQDHKGEIPEGAGHGVF